MSTATRHHDAPDPRAAGPISEEAATLVARLLLDRVDHDLIEQDSTSEEPEK